MEVTKNIEQQMQILSDYRNITRAKYGEEGLMEADYKAFHNGEYSYSRINDSKEELKDFDYQAILEESIIYALKSTVVEPTENAILSYSINLLKQDAPNLSQKQIHHLFLNSKVMLKETLDAALLASPTKKKKVMAIYDQKAHNDKVQLVNDIEKVLNQENYQR